MCRWAYLATDTRRRLRYLPAVDRLHATADAQSLALTQAAIANLRARPELIADVLRTLDHWDRVAPEASKPLRDEWRRILLEQDWERALAVDSRGQQLRQASPLGAALSRGERLTIIRRCKGPKSGI